MTREDVYQAVIKYPMPTFTMWYRNKLPVRQLTFVGAGLVVVGIILTAVHAPNLYRIIALGAFLVLLLFLAGVHTIAWVKARINDYKRAIWLGLSLRKYYNELYKLGIWW